MCCDDEQEIKEVKVEVAPPIGSFSDLRLAEIATRLARVEKELTILNNCMLALALVGTYFALQWYIKNVGKIPGVMAE